MKLGIDIDDVITDTSNEIYKYILEYDKNEEIIPYLVEIMRGEIPEIAKDFLNKNTLKIFSTVKVKENVQNIINKLLDDGDKIYIITSRGEKKYKGSKKLTLEYLKNNNIKYTKLILDSFEKAKICKENHIDILIDGSVKYCENFKNIGGQSIVFTSKVNESISTNIPRVNNWLDLYDKINEIKGK